MQAFQGVIEYLEENDDEQITVTDLVTHMATLLQNPDSEPYSPKWMKKKLQEKYEDEIVFTEINGKSNVATFCSQAKKILHTFYENSKRDTNTEQEKQEIITAAAKLIKEDIKNTVSDHETYPDLSQLSDASECLAYLPNSLKTLLDSLILTKSSMFKKASLDFL